MASANIQSLQGPHFSLHSTNDKSTNLRKMASISDVVTASVYSEKTCLKKLMKIIIISYYYYE